MAQRRYRVIKRLPWIDGGRLAPGFNWEGGRYVVYEPGDTIEIDDREVASIYHKLEALDNAGSALLEAVRAKAEAPAQITFVADLHPRAVEWLTRALDEKQRKSGNMRKLVLGILARGEDPTDEDLAAALEEAPHEPLPQELSGYLAGVLRHRVWRKSGRKAPPRTTAEDLFIQSYYHLAVEELQERFAHQKRAAIRRMAKEKTADSLGLSVRTVERVVRPRPWNKSDKA